MWPWKEIFHQCYGYIFFTVSFKTQQKEKEYSAKENIKYFATAMKTRKPFQKKNMTYLPSVTIMPVMKHIQIHGKELRRQISPFKI